MVQAVSLNLRYSIAYSLSMANILLAHAEDVRLHGKQAQCHSYEGKIKNTNT